MEDLLVKALDLGGTLVLALGILLIGCKKLDSIDDKLDKLLRLTALGFSSPDKKEQVEEILEEK